MSSNPRTLMHCGRILHSWLVLIIVASVGAYFGSYVLAHLERFDAARGDRFDYPSDHYLQLLITTPEGGLRRLAYSELADYRRKHARASLQIEPGALAVDLNTPRSNAELDYSVAEKAQGALLVETRYRDSEWRITSRYQIAREEVTPLYIHSWNHWFIAQALLYMGLPLALVIWLLGHLLQKHEERVLLARGERPYLQHRYRLT